jgi:hypothetical protein
MATRAAPPRTSTGSILQALWFRLVIRTILVLLAAWSLWLAQDWLQEFAGRRSANLSGTPSTWWFMSVGATVMAGLLFGLATWLPFTRVRYLPSRLILAAAALAPVARFWMLFLVRNQHGTGWLWQIHWFDYLEPQVCAALAGVAIASGFRSRGS